MDKDLEEIQKFANKLNNQVEERPRRIRFTEMSSRDEMFKSGAKKLNAKMGIRKKLKLASLVSMVLNVGDAKKN